MIPDCCGLGLNPGAGGVHSGTDAAPEDGSQRRHRPRHARPALHRPRPRRLLRPADICSHGGVQQQEQCHRPDGHQHPDGQHEPAAGQGGPDRQAEGRPAGGRGPAVVSVQALSVSGQSRSRRRRRQAPALPGRQRPEQGRHLLPQERRQPHRRLAPGPRAGRSGPGRPGAADIREGFDPDNPNAYQPADQINPNPQAGVNGGSVQSTDQYAGTTQ